MLIICPECGKQISDHAMVCPNCGFPMHEYVKKEVADIKDAIDPVCMGSVGINESKYSHPVVSNETEIERKPSNNASDHLPCPKCGAPLKVQLVQENKGSGCGLAIFFIIITIILLAFAPAVGAITAIIAIIVGVRGKSETNQYVICDACGFSKKADKADIESYKRKLEERKVQGSKENLP